MYDARVICSTKSIPTSDTWELYLVERLDKARWCVRLQVPDVEEPGTSMVYETIWNDSLTKSWREFMRMFREQSYWRTH